MSLKRAILWIAVSGRGPGKLTLMSDDLTNVTVKRELYEVERDGNTIEYDGMTMERVDRPTAECAAALDKAPLPTPLP